MFLKFDHLPNFLGANILNETCFKPPKKDKLKATYFKPILFVADFSKKNIPSVWVTFQRQPSDAGHAHISPGSPVLSL